MSDALSADGIEVHHPTGRRRPVKPHPAAELDLFAQAAVTDDFEKLLPDIQRAVDAIITAQGYVCWWHVRMALYDMGKIDGSEVFDAAGTFAKRCGLLARRDEDGNVKAERPDKRYNETFPKSHSNRHSQFTYPSTLAERQAAIELVK